MCRSSTEFVSSILVSNLIDLQSFSTNVILLLTLSPELLRLSGNDYFGSPIPDAFGRMPNLFFLYLEDANIAGSLDPINTWQVEGLRTFSLLRKYTDG